MNRKDFIKSIENTYRQGVEIVKKKNADYGKEDNPFVNFESAKIIGLAPEQAILLHILNKTARIGNLLKQEAKNEAIEDSILDAINYLAILKAYKEKEGDY